MKAFFDPAQLAHAPSIFLQRGHIRPYLEVPARAESLLAGCRALGLDTTIPPPATSADLETVHDPAYLSFLEHGPAAWRDFGDTAPEMIASTHPTADAMRQGARIPAGVVGALGWFTADTTCTITPDTWGSALAAASGALAAADEAASGRHAYALCRPPGHHAHAAIAAGHCYLNNAALAAERLRRRGARRVALLDIDAHHGNGTQSLFWERDDVVVVSIHGDPDFYYPWFVGRADERGAGRGEGCNLNLPLPRGTADEAWLAAIVQGLATITRARADALVVSLGMDAFAGETLAFLSISPDGFARAGALVAGAGLPAVIVQEGGYAVDALGTLLERFMNGLFSSL